jgi:hypothetical protein
VDFNTLEILGSPGAPADIILQNTQLIDWVNSTVNVTVVGGQ